MSVLEKSVLCCIIYEYTLTNFYIIILYDLSLTQFMKRKWIKAQINSLISMLINMPLARIFRDSAIIRFN